MFEGDLCKWGVQHIRVCYKREAVKLFWLFFMLKNLFSVDRSYVFVELKLASSLSSARHDLTQKAVKHDFEVD